MEIELNRLSQAGLAALFNVTTRSLMRWHRLGLPHHGVGPGSYYVWREVLPWFVVFKANPGDPRPALLSAPPNPKPGPNYFHALELMERAQEALSAEVGGTFKRRGKKAPAKKHKPRPAPVPRRPRLE